jgi:hypothetical protein
LHDSQQSRTLRAIFTEPAPANLAWADIERLLVAVGCVMTEGSGSRVYFEHGVEAESFHRPHPGKEAKRYQVRIAREFLERIGVEI